MSLPSPPPLQPGCSFEPIFDQSSPVSASMSETVKTFGVREPQELVANDFFFFFLNTCTGKLTSVSHNLPSALPFVV